MKYSALEPEEESETPMNPLPSPLHISPVPVRTPARMQARLVLVSLIGIALLLYGSVGGFMSSVLLAAQSKIIENSNTSLLEQIGLIAQVDKRPLQGQAEDRINILLLGYGGAGHPGGGLTDTIMMVSIQPTTHAVVLISLPRDMVVNFGGKKPAEQEWRKINYAFDHGGINFAQKKVEEVLDQPIHYYVTVDFDGFRKIIDDVGGLDVLVENGFIDREYPDYNYGYQTVSFEQGWQHFDGETALQYARSRHGNHGENSDFARSSRQQIILAAVRDELLSAGTILNPGKISSIIGDLGDHLRTNIEIWEMVKLSELSQAIDTNNIVSKVVDHSEGGFLASEIIPETGAYVLIPRAGLGDFSEIQHMAATVFEQPELLQEQATVAIQNGTTVTGLGARTAESVRNTHFDVTTIANATVRTAETTSIYDLTGDAKPIALDELQTLMQVADTGVFSVTRETLDAKVINVPEVPPNTDFVLVLGLDYSLAEPNE